MIQRRYAEPAAPEQSGGERASSVISAEDLRALRAVLPSDARRAGIRADVEVPLRAVCARAHRSGLRVEQLLVLVKSAWRELPETRRVEALASRDEQLDSVITALIEQYYRDDGSPST